VIPTYVDVPATLATFQSGGHVQDVDGVPMWKLAMDLRRYAMVIAATKPDVIVETGTMWGGSALWFEQYGCDVITVDIDDRPARLYSAYAKCQHTTFILGDCLDPGVLAQIRERIGGRRTMVSLDSAHDAPHVAAEIGVYAPLVTPGCYLVVEDGIFDLDPTDKGKAQGGAAIPEVGGPLRAIESILVDNPYWTRDVEIERVNPLSYYPAGWWIRK